MNERINPTTGNYQEINRKDSGPPYKQRAKVKGRKFIDLQIRTEPTAIRVGEYVSK
jgi:hypothetical protein